MVRATEVGVEIVPGITIPWEWFDSFLCGLIQSGEAGIKSLANNAVAKLDGILQAAVDNNSFQFDNVGKEQLQKAFTLAMVRRFMPELLPNP